MAKIKYKDIRLGERKLQTIAVVNSICEEYHRQGYDLTLRQLYYQFVARDYLSNTLQNYKWLGTVVDDGRMAGLIDWDHIVDRTRYLRSLVHHRDPKHRITSAAKNYQINMWTRQPKYVEVWIEKDALIGVVDQAASAHDVPFFSCRGYTSQSELWAAGQRIGKRLRTGQDVVVLHLGDHDPSGIDMTRDIKDRLNLFIDADGMEHLARLFIAKVQEEHPGVTSMELLSDEYRADLRARVWRKRHDFGHLTVRRIALNMDQVQEYQPPPNPAKTTDARYAAYRAEHGTESWELDALDPRTLDNLIQREINRWKDPDIWAEDMRRLVTQRNQLQAVADRWTDVQAFLSRGDDGGSDSRATG